LEKGEGNKGEREKRMMKLENRLANREEGRNRRGGIGEGRRENKRARKKDREEREKRENVKYSDKRD